MPTGYPTTQKEAPEMREFHQLAKFLAFTVNAGLLLGLYLSEGEQSPYLTAIATATALISIIALATAKKA